MCRTRSDEKKNAAGLLALAAIWAYNTKNARCKRGRKITKKPAVGYLPTAGLVQLSNPNPNLFSD